MTNTAGCMRRISHQHPEASALPAIPAHRSDDERLNLPGYANNAPSLPTREGYPALDPLTVDDLIIERNSSEQRRFRNLLVDEVRRTNPTFDPSGHEAHHSIPLKEYPELDPLRAKLAAWGISLHDPANGVLLPKSGSFGPGTVHGDTQHNPNYQRVLHDRFATVSNREEALFALDEIRNELRDGTFIPPKRMRP